MQDETCQLVATAPRCGPPHLSRPRVTRDRPNPTSLILPLPGGRIARIAQECLQLAIVGQNLADLGVAGRIRRVLSAQQGIPRFFQMLKLRPVSLLRGRQHIAGDIERLR